MGTRTIFHADGTRTVIPIRGLPKPDMGEGLSFRDQIIRGYKRQEAKGAKINGRATGIKRIWGNN